MKKTKVQNLQRFSFSTFKSKITNSSIFEVLASLETAVALQDIHIAASSTPGITDRVLPQLIEFLDRTKAHLKRFEISFMWCANLSADAKAAFKQQLLNDYDNLDAIVFDWVKTPKKATN